MSDQILCVIGGGSVVGVLAISAFFPEEKIGIFSVVSE